MKVLMRLMFLCFYTIFTMYFMKIFSTTSDTPTHISIHYNSKKDTKRENNQSKELPESEKIENFSFYDNLHLLLPFILIILFLFFLKFWSYNI